MNRSTHTQPSPLVRFKIHWSRIFGAAAVGLAVGFMACWGIMVATDHLPPCKTEDSTHCYWDASTQGNHQGSDFVAP